MKTFRIFIVIACFVSCRMNGMVQEAIEEATNMLVTGHLMTIAAIELFQDEAKAEKQELDTGIQQLQCYKTTFNATCKSLLKYLGIDPSKSLSVDSEEETTLEAIQKMNVKLEARFIDLSARMKKLEEYYGESVRFNTQYQQLDDYGDNAEAEWSDCGEGEIFGEETSDGGEESGEIIPLLQSPSMTKRGTFRREVLQEKQG